MLDLNFLPFNMVPLEILMKPQALVQNKRLIQRDWQKKADSKLICFRSARVSHHVPNLAC